MTPCGDNYLMAVESQARLDVLLEQSEDRGCVNLSELSDIVRDLDLDDDEAIGGPPPTFDREEIPPDAMPPPPFPPDFDELPEWKRDGFAWMRSPSWQYQYQHLGLHDD